MNWTKNICVVLLATIIPVLSLEFGLRIIFPNKASKNKNIRKDVLKNHLSFWLRWNVNVLIKRIRNSHKRPIAFKASDNELIDLIKKRSNIYSKALFEIKCDNQTKNEIVKKILEIYETNKIKN